MEKSCSIFLIFLTICLTRTTLGDVFQVCKYKGITDEVDCNLAASDGEVECIDVVDSIDCAVKLKSGDVDFASFTAEQALVVAKELDTYVKVIGEIRHPDKETESFAYQSVVVIRKDINVESGNWNSLMKKKFCHPGFKYEQLWSKRVLTEFEQKVIKPDCKSYSTSADEDFVAAVADFFGDSCRPGLWVDGNDTFDGELKQRYPNLCKLCGDRRRCEYTDPQDPHKAALQCLVNGGDIAYISRSHVEKFFEDKSNRDDYKYLCKDFTTIPISSTPCTWVSQPWSVIFAQKDKAQSIQDVIKKNSATSKILQRTEDGHISYSNSINKSPQEYMIGRDTSSKSNENCRRNIKWCTISVAEKEKCDWLSRAALCAGVIPDLECISHKNVFDCFEKINNSNTDIIAVDSNYGYLARKHYHLAPVYYHKTLNERAFMIAVMKKKSESTITSFKDLKDKKACFPEYGGLAWVSFVTVGREKKLISRKNCNYKTLVASFFSSSCAPGANTASHYITGRTEAEEEKLCSLCQNMKEPRSDSCKPSSSNEFFGNVGAMRCLINASGDIAFVNKNAISAHDFIESDFRVLCRNDSLAMRPGFNVDENCALSVTVDSEILTRRKDSYDRNYEQFLNQLEKWFGIEYNRKQNTMQMFKQFKNQSNLLFKDNVIGFDWTNNPTNKYTKNYNELFRNVDDCSHASIPKMITTYLFILILCIPFINNLF